MKTQVRCQSSSGARAAREAVAGARLPRSCSAARSSCLGPELSDQIGKAFEVRPAVDPPLSAAAALARDRHVTELGEARERIVEGDDRVALRLVHLAEEEAGRELPPHLPGERILADRPFLLRRDRSEE